MKRSLIKKKGCSFKKYSNGLALGKGVALLLVWSFFVQCFGYFTLLRVSIALSIYSPDHDYLQLGAFISAAQFISYMLYPVAGLVAEVCLTRFKVMIIGTIMAFIGMVIAVPFIATTSVENCNFDDNFFDCSVHFNLSVVSIALIGTIIHHGGLGLFEANAIQFGADQLQFASNDQLSSFVSWYFWSAYIVKLFVVYISVSMFLNESQILGKLLFIAPAILGLLISLPLALCGCKYNKHFVKEPVSNMNPVTHIYKVLRFVIKHNKPLNRSALTYGEIPSRMDYAKERYGGPFTTEQVEDVKTFGRISLLLLTLFGSLLRLESNTLYSLFGIEYLILIVWIPMYMLVIRPCCCQKTNRFTIMMKMGFGLLLAVLYNFIRFIISVIIEWVPKIGSPYATNPKIIPLQFLGSLLCSCLLILVFLSAFEFILAQAPRSMQGLLIGLWYAFQSLSVVFYLLTYNLEQWIIYTATISTVLSIVSLISFLCVSKWYKYRQREEFTDVNRHSIIKKYTVRQLLTEQKEKQLFIELNKASTLLTVHSVTYS